MSLADNDQPNSSDEDFAPIPSSATTHSRRRQLHPSVLDEDSDDDDVGGKNGGSGVNMVDVGTRKRRRVILDDDSDEEFDGTDLSNGEKEKSPALKVIPPAAMDPIILNYIRFFFGAEDANQINRFGQTPLHLAVADDDESGVFITLLRRDRWIRMKHKQDHEQDEYVASAMTEEPAQTALRAEWTKNADFGEVGALKLAVRNGSANLVDLILQQEEQHRKEKIATGDFRGEWHEIVQSAICYPTNSTEILKRLLSYSDVKHTDGKTLFLHVAASSRNVEAIQPILEIGGVDINQQRLQDGETALHRVSSWTACYDSRHQRQLLKRGNDFVRKLVKFGADANLRNSNGDTALHFAVGANLETVRIILEEGSGIKVNAQNRRGITPLIGAIDTPRTQYSDTVEIVNLLLQHGADPNLQEYDNQETALHRALGQSKYNHEVIRLLLAHGANVNLRCGSMFEHGMGATVLAKAVAKRRLSILRILLEHCATEKSILPSTYDQALHLASEVGARDQLILLLEQRKASSNVQGKDESSNGDTALHGASYKGQHGCVMAFIEYNNKTATLDWNIQNSTGDTPLHAAARRGHTSIVKELLRQDGIDCNMQNNTGETALHHAAQSGSISTVQELLKHDGINLNVQDTEYGNTPLHRAAISQHRPIMVLLLKQDGLDLERRNNLGDTALMTAAKYGRGEIEIVDLLLQRGAMTTVVVPTNAREEK